MVPADYHTFYATTGSVAGALIGLLFVAVSVAHDRADLHTDSQRRRAGASLTVFTNALVLSLFALTPDTNIGHIAVVLAALGLGFVVASMLSIVGTVRARDRPSLASLVFLVGLTVIFGLQLYGGIQLFDHGHDKSDISLLSTLVIVCFAVGIARAWDLIGGPQVKLASEAARLLREERERLRAEPTPRSGPPTAPPPVPPSAPPADELKPAADPAD